MNKKAKLTLGLFLISIAYMIFFMHPTIWRDESFTMALVGHNYGDIIRLDSMDVHPPFYYIALRFFLSITAFWTNSLFTKVIIARLFSYILAILTFLTLSKTVKNLGVPGANAIQWAGFFLAPSIMRYSTQIRMYALAALFLALVLNQLQHYDNSQKIGHIFLAVIFASFASYTHYFAAVAAGWMLFLYFVKFQFNRYDGNAILRGIVVFLVMFVPWGVVAFSQAQQVSSSYWIPPVNVDNIINNFVNLFADVFTDNGGQYYAIAFMVLLIYPTIWAYLNMSKKFKSTLTIVLLVFVLTTLTGIAISVAVRPIYIARYAYPAYAVVIFFMMTIVSQMMKKPLSRLSNYFMTSILAVGLTIIIGMNVGFLGSNQFNNYIMPSYNLADSVEQYKENPNNVIHLNPNQSPNSIVEKTVYIKSINKRVYIKNFNVARILGKDNQKLFYGLFDNVDQSSSK
ncbi:hypothetical protein [Apilactobacillus kunkeei]|uniref:hypothetical protein n=1 Tax=Apilactobacillus kunkeei TaxID=148814 RepID=UPI00200B46FD|nr:hypothetical protein [Apilactobacillus kunkeei]MCK8629121.1 hypothetical protein [Apilactobacillus kunkeei]CAI2652684.1 hypothetical protein AKUH1B302M_13070 [Apilactobacillus kunkeei]CAI2653122.1 hypothetical protein AKUH4B402J_12800 [Apilactobacillus kunkeei]